MADAYSKGPEIELNSSIKKLFHGWLYSEYTKVTKHCDIHYVAADIPLDTVKALFEASDRLFISTLGTSAVSDLMTDQENLHFRAVHDWMHLKIGADATWQGELATTLAHLNTAPKEIWPIIVSEVAGQASVTITTGNFPEQRLSAACAELLLGEGTI
jgi:predicted Zn-dependent protease